MLIGIVAYDGLITIHLVLGKVGIFVCRSEHKPNSAAFLTLVPSLNKFGLLRLKPEHVEVFLVQLVQVRNYV